MSIPTYCYHSNQNVARLHRKGPIRERQITCDRIWKCSAKYVDLGITDHTGQRLSWYASIDETKTISVKGLTIVVLFENHLLQRWQYWDGIIHGIISWCYKCLHNVPGAEFSWQKLPSIFDSTISGDSFDEVPAWSIKMWKSSLTSL